MMGPPIHMQQYPLPPFQSRFGGYYWPEKSSAPDLYLEGHQQAKQVFAEIDYEGTTHPIPLTKEGFYWSVPQSEQSAVRKTLASAIHSGQPFLKYRFIADGRVLTDVTEQPLEESSSPWSLARPMPAAQQGVGSMLYLYPDSLVAANEKNDSLAVTDAFTVHGGTAQGAFDRLEAVIQDPISQDRTQALGAVMLTPLSGDWVSSHHYWTADPFGSVWRDADLKRLMQYQIQDGIKVFFDAAFVNHGIQSPQYQSLLMHGSRSPYWRWYFFDRNDQGKPSSQPFPSLLSDSKPVLGVLPLASDGYSVDWDAFMLRIVNNPLATEEGETPYNPNRPTFIQLEPTKSKRRWRSNTASVYRYTLPIASVPRFKNQLLQLNAKGVLPQSKEWKQALLDQPNAAMASPVHDNSGEGWDGKTHAKRLNLNHPHVRQQAQQALEFWTRRADLQWLLLPLTEVLTQAKVGKKTWLQAISQLVDQKQLASRIAQGLPDSALLPKKRFLQEPLEQGRDLARLFPPVALPLNHSDPEQDLTFVKATLGHPHFNQQVLEHRGWRQPLAKLLSPVLWLLKQFSLTQPWFKHLNDWLNRETVAYGVGEAIVQAVALLDEETRQKFLEPSLQEAALMTLAPLIWRQLLTGQSSDAVKAMGSGMDRLVGKALCWEPDVAMPVFRRAMQGQIKAINPQVLAQSITQTLKSTTAEAATVARYLMTQGEMGLNWRLDAAVDIANTTAIRNTPSGGRRDEVFWQEMRWVKETWAQLLSGARKIFPKAVITAELDPEKLGVSSSVLKKTYEIFFEPQVLSQGVTDQSVFTSMPNMSYWFSGIPALLHSPPKPHEHGDKPLFPQEFMDQKILAFLKKFPRWVSQHALAMLSSHDYANVNHTLLRNPQIASMSYDSQRGLLDDMNNVLHALQLKADLIHPRQALERVGIGTKELDDLNAYLHQQLPQLTKELDAYVADHITAEQKTVVQKEEGLPKPPETLRGMRFALAKAVPAMIKSLKQRSADDGDDLPEALQPFANEQALSVLEEVLTHYLPLGELWAYRAVLTNGVETLKGLPKGFKGSFYKVLEAIESDWMALEPTLMAHQDPSTILRDLFQHPLLKPYAKWEISLWNHLMEPVSAQRVKTLFAQTAVGGYPVIHSSEWWAQALGESTENRHQAVRDKNIRPYADTPCPDWLKRDQAAMRMLGQLRQQYAGAFNGFFQALPQDDLNQVATWVWDGGPQSGGQQVILIQALNPMANESFKNPLGTGKTYPTPRLTKSKFNYALNLKALGMPEGTTYVQINQHSQSSTVYTLSKDGILMDSDGKGLTLDPREPGVWLARRS
ncbi:MAG: hypothetical protein U0003_03900 [Vampirovibrionales bacterium]